MTEGESTLWRCWARCVVSAMLQFDGPRSGDTIGRPELDSPRGGRMETRSDDPSLGAEQCRKVALVAHRRAAAGF